MSKLLKAASLILTAILMTTAIGCVSSDDTSSGGGTVIDSSKYDKPDYSEGEAMLADNGKSEYKIVKPQSSEEYENWAASELSEFFEQATGVELSVITDNDKSLGNLISTKNKYIYLGQTKITKNLTAKNDLIPSYEAVGESGFKIKTVDNSLFICGASATGTANGVYELLDLLFDYDCYAVDELYVKQETSVKLPELDYVYRPTFDYREASYREVKFNNDLKKRMRFDKQGETFVFGSNCHNSFEVICYDESSKGMTLREYNSLVSKHSDWFASSEWEKLHPPFNGERVKSQLCYSNEEMTNEFIRKLKLILKDTTAPIMQIGMEDNDLWCTCLKCTASKLYYGSDSAVMIKFMNKVATEINAWRESEGKEPMDFCFFAYYKTELPPSKNLSELKMNEHVGVYFAPIRAKFAFSFNDEINEEYANNYKAWAELTDKFYIFSYATYTGQTLIFHDTFRVLKENQEFYKKYGAIYMYEMTEHWQERATAWSRCKAYVISKLEWNLQLDTQDLIEEFFVHYFKDASDIMLEIFTEERAHMASIYKPDGTPNGFIGENVLSTDYWGYAQLNGWLEKIDEAYQAIAYLKNINKELYDKLYYRINLESIQFRYIMISLYGDTLCNNVTQMKQQFKKDFESLGMSAYCENQDISALWSSWNVS